MIRLYSYKILWSFLCYFNLRTSYLILTLIYREQRTLVGGVFKLLVYYFRPQYLVGTDCQLYPYYIE
ncbi:hypothetical protein LEQ41_07200 [Streptococcus agalactiae]|nr:hypothetical protein [Streptococcus agalactiae]